MRFELRNFFLCADMFPNEDSKTVSVCLYLKKRNHHSFVNISPTLVIDTSMKRSSRVLQHGNQKNLIFFFFFLKFEIEFDLYFDLCWRAEIIQVGRNMHLYVDIGDASSSLWGSTSSFFFFFLVIAFSSFCILWMNYIETFSLISVNIQD